MRSTTVKGLNDNLRHDFGSDVSMVATVMNIGVCTAPLCYEKKLNGKELKEFYRSAKVGFKHYYDEIIDENEYLITAYDW